VANSRESKSRAWVISPSAILGFSESFSKSRAAERKDDSLKLGHDLHTHLEQLFGCHWLRIIVTLLLLLLFDLLFIEIGACEVCVEKVVAFFLENPRQVLANL
jgi:hypothetical protein